MREDVADGFVVGQGASANMRQAHLLEQFNKPFWLQLVGTGLTTTWAAHLGAVFMLAKWPAVTCLNIYESQLITEPITIQGGLHRVPAGPGLGVTVDEAAVERYRVDYTFLETPKHVYRYSRANGEVTYYGCGKQELHRIYPDDAQPVSEPGSTLDVVADDGSDTFAELYDSVQNGRTLHRREAARASESRQK